jgi:Na+/melibiose symporter-like transporter
MARLTAATVGPSTGLSVITTYLPLLLERFTTSRTLIGLAIGGEGAFGLAIPMLAGALSDRIWTRWGRRRPFMLFSAPFMAAALVMLPFQTGFFSLAGVTFLFFAGYHFYMAPYQSLLPDLTPYSQQGRIQGTQSLMRGIGMFLGMVLAGFLFERSESSPFLMAAFVVLFATYVTASGISEPRPADAPRGGAAPLTLADGGGGTARGRISRFIEAWTFERGVAALRGALSTTRSEKPILNLLVANFLWESTIAGVRPFLMLYFLYVLGVGTDRGALLLGLVGLTYVSAGLLGGFLADRLGRRRMMAWGLAIYLAGCLLGFFVRDVRLAAVLLPLFGFGGSIVLTLPYALLMGLMPPGKEGHFTGLFVMSRALAIVVAPVVVGVAIDLAAEYDPVTRGLTIIWPLAAGAVLLSFFFYRRSRPVDGDRPGVKKPAAGSV